MGYSNSDVVDGYCVLIDIALMTYDSIIFLYTFYLYIYLIRYSVRFLIQFFFFFGGGPNLVAPRVYSFLWTQKSLLVNSREYKGSWGLSPGLIPILLHARLKPYPLNLSLQSPLFQLLNWLLTLL